MIPSDKELIEFYKEQDLIDAKEQHQNEMSRVKRLNHIRKVNQLKYTRLNLDKANSFINSL